MGYMNTYAAAIGNEVRAARARGGMTREGLAAAMSRPEEWLVSHESGEDSFTVEELAVVARILNTSFLDLLPNKVL